MKTLSWFGAVAGIAALSGCAPAIENLRVLNVSEGRQKTLAADITSWFTIVGNKRVEYTVPGSPPQTGTPSVTSGGRNELAIPNSETLNQGTEINYTWSVNYAPLLFPFGASTATKSSSFVVGPQARVDLQPQNICIHQGGSTPVEVSLEPPFEGGATVPVSLSTNPASIALPQATPVQVSNENDVGVNGLALGDSVITGTAAEHISDQSNIEVIPAVAAPSLLLPDDEATDVFFGSNPVANPLVSVQLTWNDVPGAVSSTQKFIITASTDNNEDFIETNSSVPNIVLSLKPGLRYNWKVKAKFARCGGGTEYGPDSEIRQFTVWEEED